MSQIQKKKFPKYLIPVPEFRSKPAVDRMNERMAGARTNKTSGMV
jgi:hypothetical protein